MDEERMVRILIVAAHLGYRMALKEVLLRRFPQLELEEAGDQFQTMMLLNSFSPDVILVDIHLPECNGLELARKIKLSYQSTVILLGSYNIPEYRYAVLQSGADYFLSKDAPLEVVFDLVHEVIFDKSVC